MPRKHINAKMRAILIDWLVDVHKVRRLKSEPSSKPSTLHICVSLIDWYCSREDVPLDTLQLAGITALKIACESVEEGPAWASVTVRPNTTTTPTTT